MKYNCDRLLYGMKEFFEDMSLDEESLDGMEFEFESGATAAGNEAAEFFLACKARLDEARPEIQGVNQFDAQQMTAHFINTLIVHPNDNVVANDEDPEKKD